MEITDIRLTKRGRISIYADGEFTCVLHQDVFALSALSCGQQVDPSHLEELSRESGEKFARERALNLLSARSYTQKGLMDKLSRHTDPDSARAAVERMEELGLVDDRDYARRFAADCMRLKGYSLRRTAQALREKGIHRDIVDEIVGGLEQDAESAIAKVITRKYMQRLDDEAGKNKVLAALARLGYDYGDVRRVISNLLEDADYYTDWED